jgi:hypothetical protein
MGGKSLVNYGVRPNRDILFLNTSNQVCPAYSPISFCWGYAEKKQVALLQMALANKDKVGRIIKQDLSQNLTI